MSTITSLHTVVPLANVPLGYFDEDNIRFVQKKVGDVLQKEYSQRVLIDRGSIIRIMQRALTDRIESIPRMNERAVMMICNEVRNHQGERTKHLKWEDHFFVSQQLHDPTVGISRYDPSMIKLANRLGKRRVGGTTRFYFT